MAFIEIPGVSVKGIAGCVPARVLENSDYPGFQGDEAARFMDSTGVVRHRISDEKTCASDLCVASASRLLDEMNWERGDVDCLVFVTQTPDFQLPSTATLIQKQLGLKEEIASIDISLGCSGWVYGLLTISSLMSHGYLKKGLLLAGDTILKTCSREDRSTFPLFGDAGTATAIQFDPSSEGIRFHLASDGSGYESIIIPGLGFRNQLSSESLESSEIEPGIKRSKVNLSLDGMSVFSFGISKAPESVLKFLKHFDINSDGPDYYFFHQANLFMNEKIRKKLKIPAEKVPYSLKEFGNTSSASIPLTMVSQVQGDLSGKELNIMVCGFGVGLSWGTASFRTNRITVPEIIEL